MFEACPPHNFQMMKPVVKKAKGFGARFVKWQTWALSLGILALVAGCATPIGVNYVDRSVAYQSLTANAISAEKPGSFSARELMNRNLYQRFEEDPAKGLAELHASLASEGDEDLIFALAELSFFYANNSGDRSYYLAAAVYAYAFLMPGQLGRPPEGVDPRLRWATDIYNQALAQAAKSHDGAFAIPMGGTFRLPFGELTVTFNEADLIWADYRMKDFIPAADVEVRGLRNRYRTPGIGAPLAASIEPIGATTTKQDAYIPLRLKIPVTAFLRLDDPRGALKSGKLKGELEFYTPNSARSIKVNGVEVPIEFETTSALALTLEGSPVWDSEIAGFRSGDFAPGAQKLGIYMLHPHRSGRIPVVLVHGTASSPARWAELVNELENDPRFWEHYEIWLFIYNTGNPIAYSGMLLRDALTKAVADLDPEGKDPGLKQMVVIGHSQGGLLTKMTVVDSGMQLWPFNVPPEELTVSAETRDLVTHALIFKPLPFVKRVVFIATPHGGSYQALGFLGRLGSWFVNLPGRFVKINVELLTLQTQGLYMGTVGNVPTSITNMTPGNPFIKNLATVPIADGVVAHSIIALADDGPLEDAGDGVVKYTSAHIEGVESEKIVRSGHSVQGNPEAIQEVKRILIEHARGLSRPQKASVSSSN
jgi:triacylglycerol esterase/lipase EstA (alpha/beta hydrolase family)